MCLAYLNSKSKARRLKTFGLASLVEWSSVAQAGSGWCHGPGMFMHRPGYLCFGEAKLDL